MEKTKLTPRARELRKNATPQERKLWYLFLSKHPAHFRRQHPIGPYIADFFCQSAQLVIELDGSGHFQPDGMEYDRWRNAYMQGLGLRILRFTNSQVDKEFYAVCSTIERTLVTPSVTACGGDSSPRGGAK